MEEARAAARVCAENALTALQEELGTLDRIERILTVTGFVASAPGFEQQPAVIDGASELLFEVFGEAGRHTRSALGRRRPAEGWLRRDRGHRRDPRLTWLF